MKNNLRLAFSFNSDQTIYPMKAFILSGLCLILTFFSQKGIGQSVNVTIIIPPPYSPYLQDYLQYENKMVIQLQNLTTQSLSVKLIGTIEGDNGISLQTNGNYQPASPITLQPNGLFRIAASSRARGFLDPDNLDFTGPENLKTQILKDGILPEGTYTICIQAVGFTDNLPLSDEAPAGCALLPISFPTPPQLVTPECEETLEKSLPFFQWTLPGGNTGTAALSYDLFITEWLRGANPQDLMQLAIDYNAGNAIVRRNLASPSYQFNVTDPKLKEGTNYLWAVRVKDRMGKITFENNGVSEICAFTTIKGDDDDDGGTIVMTQKPDYEIQQNRTNIKGKLKYKFPGQLAPGIHMVNRNLDLNLNFQTEETPYQSAIEQPGELGIFNNGAKALANHNYIDAFPIPQEGAKALKNMQVKLIQSWVVADCNVTFTNEETGQSRTVHKDFFIIPDEYNTLGQGHQLNVQIDGITDNPYENPIEFGQQDLGASLYNRVLSVDRTDENGNYSFSFTQSAPGLLLTHYQGHVSITHTCEGVDTWEEENDFVHPLDMHSFNDYVYGDPHGDPHIGDSEINPAVVINPAEGINPSGFNSNNAVPRSGIISSDDQMAYQSVEISGGSLYKVLRLEVASPYFYSPNLIFWTHPGDTVTLPDQISYVKAIEVEMLLEGGTWEHNRQYQNYDEGLPIPGVDLLFSRKKEGLPAAIPMEEGQALRDYEGESNSGNGEWELYDETMQYQGYNADALYDSVSIIESPGSGKMLFKRLVASHPYYVRGSHPERYGDNYEVPLQSKEYEIFDPEYCTMNLEVNLNSFSGHMPVFIRDTMIAFPKRPKVFGRVVTATDATNEGVAHVTVLLQRFENDVLKQTIPEYTDQNGMFRFDNIPINEVNSNDFLWKLFFSEPGYEDTIRPIDLPQTPGPDYMPLRPGTQWDVTDVKLIPLGHVVGYVKNEEGELIQALVKLADGPHIQTDIVSKPMGVTDFCGDINNLGDAINESTKIKSPFGMHVQDIEAVSTQAARFSLPARSGNNLKLVVIPLPEQYFQDTCFVDIDDVPQGQFQNLGFITVKEKLHRIRISVKGPDGEPVQAKVYVGEHVRQTNELGGTAFKWASAASSGYHVRIVPELSTLVPIDTLMDIPVSKTYLSHTFRLKQGRQIRVLVVRDYSDSEHQPANPIPIQGVTVETLLSTSQTGNSYIQCVTGADGICTLDGVPTSPETVDIRIWKEDENNLYIGKTVPVSTSRPLNPPFKISMKVLSNMTVPDIWGFPTAITGMRIRTTGGITDTLMKGIITSIPENNRFKSKESSVQIPYPETKFTFMGRRNNDGDKILEPGINNIVLQQMGIESVLFDEFDVTAKPKKNPGMQTQSVYMLLQKISADRGKIEGVVETELSSFNFSYSYNGKFFLGKTPTEYNINIFQSGIPHYTQLSPPSLIVMGQDPEPGPDDFYLLDIGPNNRPRSHQFTVFDFPASSDSSRSFVNKNAFYIHTILHTNIPFVTPSDLKLSVGKIVVNTDEIQTLDNGHRKLEFKMGTLWNYYSTTPYRYDPDIGGITTANGYISTGQVDVPMRNPIIKPNKLFMNDIDNISKLTLAGIKDLQILPDVGIILGPGDDNIGWKLTVQKNDQDDNESVAVAMLTGLPQPIFDSDESLTIYSILLDSENPDFNLTLGGVLRPYDIADFAVLSISTGQDYFSLNGAVQLGREGVRVPRMQESYLQIQFNGPKNNLSAKIVSSIGGSFETLGQVNFSLDSNTGDDINQSWSDKRYVSTGVFKVYEGSDTFYLNGILDVRYNEIKIHVIDKGLEIPVVVYDRGVDQLIHLGEGDKKLIVRDGVQIVNGDVWDPLTYTANMLNFKGASPTQAPMTFVVTGSVETHGAEIEVKDIDLGFGNISLSYDFEAQALYGSMQYSFTPSVTLGPVLVDYIGAEVQVDPDGFIFSAEVQGRYLGVFNVLVGLLVGAHSNIPDSIITNAMKRTEIKEIPLMLQDHAMAGFYLTGHVDIIDAYLEGSLPLIIPTVEVKLGAEMGFDARIYMDFSGNTTYFGFDAYAYAIGIAMLKQDYNPLEICLRARLQVLFEMLLSESNGNWVFEGGGCGSLEFDGPLDIDFDAKVELKFSSDTGIDGDVALFEHCGNGNDSNDCESN